MSTELASAANHLARVLESLHHEKHASALRPIHKRLRQIFARRFRAQSKAFLSESERWLRKMAEKKQESIAWVPYATVSWVIGVVEADAASRARMQAAVTAKIRATTALSEDWPERDANAFDAAMTAASQSAVARMTADFQITLAKDAGNRFAQDYLREHGFTQLASDIDTVTRDRMANAVAEVYSEGGSYNDAVSAIRKSFAEMTTERADIIARTEIADSYNSAMLASAREAGGMVKTWNAEGPNPCPLCIDNEDEGEIPLDQDFGSGHDAPPGHPSCMCSVGFVRE